MTFRRAIPLFVALLLAFPAMAKDASIDAFKGQWRGNALSENDGSVYFQVTARDLDVQISGADNGFTITWTTIQRQKGSTANPTAVNKSTTMTFAATGKPNLWRATDTVDPMQGVYAWARIRGNTLTVNSMVIGDDGAFELQIYERTLTGEGMTLQFARHRDGERVRTAKGRMVKIAR